MMKVEGVDIYSSIYPYILKQIYSPPKKLFLKGDISLLEDTSSFISVVGTRKVSNIGRELTLKYCKKLSRLGNIIVSGLAIGIDTISHEAALSESGKTIAVLPTPIEKIYPSRNIPLSEDILENGGLLISEYEEGSVVTKRNFYFRNRIIAGLSPILFVPECEEKSGSMITIKFAFEENRDVFVLSPDLLKPSGSGNKYVIDSSIGEIMPEI